MRARLGQGIEVLGAAACLGGLALAFLLALGDGPLVGLDRPLAATLLGVAFLLPGLALIGWGERIAGDRALSYAWALALMSPRRASPARRLAVLVCLLIAALCLVAMASLWPEIRARMG